MDMEHVFHCRSVDVVVKSQWSPKGLLCISCTVATAQVTWWDANPKIANPKIANPKIANNKIANNKIANNKIANNKIVGHTV